ncbi:hypothetical protein [Paenibacillus kobensis]|uniref:hypothetical protein n=1 Tax=Paenibacillus kobensis TaxID=59841 RepID=UPI000FD84C1B|nr:hypothetical protein [Paenibacillus kobensis]
MKRKTVTYSVITLALLGVAGISIVYGNGVLRNDGPQYRDIGIPSATFSIPSAVEEQSDVTKAMMDQKRAEEMNKLMDIVKQLAPESDGGSYVDESGSIVIQVASKSNPDLEKKLLDASEQPNKVNINYVKYSESELEESYKIINSKKDLGIYMSIVDIKKNRITVYISENELEKHRADITNAVPEDMIDWYVGELRVVDQAGAI